MHKHTLHDGRATLVTQIAYRTLKPWWITPSISF